MKPIVMPLLAAAALAGCVSAGDSGALTALPDHLVGGARIASVDLRNTPGNTAQGFDTRFEAALQSRLDRCADGTEPLTLQVTLDGYYAPNPLMNALAPMKSEIRGVARLYDATGAMAGEYRIEHALTIGGLLGGAMALAAEENLTNAFAAELCKQAFGEG